MKVSVVIPAYNASATLPATLDSVLGQEIDGLEVIVVDDGSRDATAEVAGSYGPTVQCITTPNQGVSRARNTGIAQATGDVVAFVDADDAWLPGKLRAQMAALGADEGAGACYTGAFRADAELQVLEEIHTCAAPDLTRALLFACVVSGSASSVVARREVLDLVGGFDPALSQCADWDMWLRLSVATRFVAVPQAYLLYRTHPDSMSTNVPLLERDSFAMLDKFFVSDSGTPYRGEQRRATAANWSVLAGSYLAAGDVGASLRCLGRVASTHPPTLRHALGLPLRRLRRKA